MKTRLEELSYLIEDKWNKMCENGYDMKLIAEYATYILEKHSLTSKK